MLSAAAAARIPSSRGVEIATGAVGAKRDGKSMRPVLQALPNWPT
jgi:hypothetical protein